MISVRIAGGMVIAGTAAAVIGCSPATERPATPAGAVVATHHPSETVTPLIHQALPNVHGKTFTSATVTFPPGARAAPHRHGNAFVYAYVLDGAVRSRLDGEPMRTEARTGWSGQEPTTLPQRTPATEPAKLIVVFVSTTGDGSRSTTRTDSPRRYGVISLQDNAYRQIAEQLRPILLPNTHRETDDARAHRSESGQRLQSRVSDRVVIRRSGPGECIGRGNEPVQPGDVQQPPHPAVRPKEDEIAAGLPDALQGGDETADAA